MALLRSGTREAALGLAHAEGVAQRPQAAHIPLQMLAAPGWGALAGECRVDDLDTEHLVGTLLGDASARTVLGAERAVLVIMAARHSAPVGALAKVVEDLDEDGRVALRLFVRGISTAAGDSLLWGCATVSSSALRELTDADKLGRRVGAELLDPGAGARDVDPALPGPVVA
jgi:hydroxymethylbilane synthase